MRCVGTRTGETRGDLMENVNVLVGRDSNVELQFFDGKPQVKRVMSMSGEGDNLLDLAHQLIAAHLIIQERKR